MKTCPAHPGRGLSSTDRSSRGFDSWTIGAWLDHADLSASNAEAGSTEIARNIAGVAEAAKNTTIGANDSQNAAAELAHMASELQDLVGNFTIEKSETKDAAVLQQVAAAMQALQGSAGNSNGSQMDQLRAALQGLISRENS